VVGAAVHADPGGAVGGAVGAARGAGGAGDRAAAVRGARALVALLGAPFLLPAVVAVFGLLAVWGRGGWVSEALAAAGFGRLDIYGLTGVVLAHVFFNLPLVTRLLLQGWLAIPAEQFRLAAQLGFRPRDVFLRLEGRCCARCCPGRCCWSSCSA
jgi:thiamine transport system permease protein